MVGNGITTQKQGVSMERERIVAVLLPWKSKGDNIGAAEVTKKGGKKIPYKCSRYGPEGRVLWTATKKPCGLREWWTFEERGEKRGKRGMRGMKERPVLYLNVWKFLNSLGLTSPKFFRDLSLFLLLLSGSKVKDLRTVPNISP